eukprot:Pgem_evm1s8195
MELYAQITGSLMYVIFSPILRYGPNLYHFPYAETNPYIDTVSRSSDFTEKQYKDSLFFYLSYMRIFYPKLNTVVIEYGSIFWRSKWKLGSILMMVTITNVAVIKMMVSFGRVWWLHTESCRYYIVNP